MENVDEFIESPLVEKGFTSLEPDTKKELMEEMKSRLFEQINREAVMKLSEEKAAELAEKAEKPDFTDEKFAEFLQNSGVNLTEVALDTMLKFRTFYLGAE